MKLSNFSKLVTALIVAITFELFSADNLLAQNAYTIVDLSGNHSLVHFGSNKEVQLIEIDGTLQGIDFRPANGLLYLVTDIDKLYSINPNTGG